MICSKCGAESCRCNITLKIIGKVPVQKMISILFCILIIPILFSSMYVGRYYYLTNMYIKKSTFIQNGQQLTKIAPVNNLPLGILLGILSFIIAIIILKKICKLLVKILNINEYEISFITYLEKVFKKFIIIAKKILILVTIIIGIVFLNIYAGKLAGTYIGDKQTKWAISKAQAFVIENHPNYDIRFAKAYGYNLGERSYPFNEQVFIVMTLPYEVLYFIIFSKPFLPMSVLNYFLLIDDNGDSRSITAYHRVFPNGYVETMEWYEVEIILEQ
jgi:hypothetical protein